MIASFLQYLSNAKLLLIFFASLQYNYQHEIYDNGQLRLRHINSLATIFILHVIFIDFQQHNVALHV